VPDKAVYVVEEIQTSSTQPPRIQLGYQVIDENDDTVIQDTNTTVSVTYDDTDLSLFNKIQSACGAPTRIVQGPPAVDPTVDRTKGLIVGRNVRTSDSPTFQGTAVRILSTRAPVVDGRSYAIVVDGEVEMTSAGAATTQHELRYTTNDVEPTTSDTQLARAVTYQDPSGTPVAVHDEAYFHASANGFLRVAVCSHRPVGSNTGQWTADTDRPMTLTIVDVGPTVATSGTVYS
jgi:hypothetical protein